MIRFEFTDNYVYTCRDCRKRHTCTFTRGKTSINNLPCLEAELESRQPKVTDAISDYENLKHQITNMICIIETTKRNFRIEDIQPKSFNTGVFKRQHTYTEYCNFAESLKAFYAFLKDNEEYKDNDIFIDEMIKTRIILNDDGKIEVDTYNKKLREWIRNN